MKPFKRGHIRRSSYESAQIQLNHQPRSHFNVRKANSLNRPSNTIEMTAEDLKRLSLEEGKQDDFYLSAASLVTDQTVDSAVGESGSSKWSSLERRSEASSHFEWNSDVDSCYSSRGEKSHFAGVDYDDKTATTKKSVTWSERTVLSKKKFPLPSISFPRKLFFSNKQPIIREYLTNGNSKTPLEEKKSFKERNVLSTTGLILETRPQNLPAKSDEEEAKHRAQYDELIAQNKKKEARRVKDQKRLLDQQRKFEDRTSAACREWSESILPKWDETRNTKRCRTLWWQGIPPKVRGKVWSLVIGNELNLTRDLYNICCARAMERIKVSNNCSEKISERSEYKETFQVNRESSVELIHLDVSRTFSSLGIFQEGGPYHDLLFNLLGAYVCYRPDVGYLQSMSFIAALLLLQLDTFEAFVTFANLLNRPLQLAFFRLWQPQMTVYFIAYDQYFNQELHKLHAHFDELDVRPDLYLIEWLYTLYAKSLPLDVTCRIWDIYFRDGEEFLFKTALGILRLYEQELLQMDFDEVVHFLTHLPETLSVEELIRNIEPFMRNYPSSETAKGKRRFLQIYADVNERVNIGNQTRCESSFSIQDHMDFTDPDLKNSQLSRISSNVQNVKMSKSLSGFLDDLLRSESDKNHGVQISNSSSFQLSTSSSKPESNIKDLCFTLQPTKK